MPPSPPTNPGKDHSDSRLLEASGQLPAPCPLCILPAGNHILPYALHSGWALLFSFPSGTPYRAVGDSWCIAQGHPAPGDATCILDLYIYYSCLHSEEGAPFSYSHKDVTGASKGPVNSDSSQGRSCLLRVWSLLGGTSERVTYGL